MRLILVLLFLCASTAFASQGNRGADTRTVQSFIRNVASTCASRHAQACVDAGWKFAVTKPHLGLTLPELVGLRQRFGQWFGDYQDILPPEERGSILIGLLLADGIGMRQLHRAFDSDRDGRVTQRELLADVTLDDRPLGAVLSDANAVNRKSLALRLGMPPNMIEGLFPEPAASKPAR